MVPTCGVEDPSPGTRAGADQIQNNDESQLHHNGGGENLVWSLDQLEKEKRGASRQAKIQGLPTAAEGFSLDQVKTERYSDVYAKKAKKKGLILQKGPLPFRLPRAMNELTGPVVADTWLVTVPAPCMSGGAGVS